MSIGDWWKITGWSGTFRLSRTISGSGARWGIGLANTAFGVRVEKEEMVVGMGRIFGDGALFFEIVDIAVLPEHQGKGLGAIVMDALMAFLYENATPGAFVSPISFPGASGFYEIYGFETCPPESPGMSLIIR